MAFGKFIPNSAFPWHQVNSFTHSFSTSTRGQPCVRQTKMINEVSLSLRNAVTLYKRTVQLMLFTYSDFTKWESEKQFLWDLSQHSVFGGRAVLSSTFKHHQCLFCFWLYLAKQHCINCSVTRTQIIQHVKFIYIISSKLETEETILSYKSIIFKERKEELCQLRPIWIAEC